ncbi:hypothetical protein OPU71_05930 [Niveibacterium sp. 24ML]|uniref:hypothetical protein n=1 Tax=Niveibacterium sp. 24ML TaxID=2985512 RepID=UPI00226DB3F3|nr:hypothetical protein [Niveibacterium sp. 24ML]MCX9155662.1 hypothetical protein [Niveibacterium sp. 24ML]
MPQTILQKAALLTAATLCFGAAQAHEAKQAPPQKPAFSASIPSGKIVVIGHRKALQAKAKAPSATPPAPLAAARPAAASATPCRG